VRRFIDGTWNSSGVAIEELLEVAEQLYTWFVANLSRYEKVSDRSWMT
jgi:hypothetical protein